MENLYKNIHIGNNIPISYVDGVDIINLFNPSTELGKALSPFTIKNGTNFLRWKFYSTKNLMDFVRLEGYDEKWLQIKNHNNTLKKKINSLKNKTVDDYWGVVLLFIIKKVQEDKELQKLLYNNTKPFSMYKEEEEESTLLGNKIKIKKKIDSFHGYCKIVTFIGQLVKEFDINNQESLSEGINKIFPNLKNTIDKILA